MAKCHVCDQRKGKRPCPAGSAPICPRCCAQNRVVEIDCPEDCPFLGAEGSILVAARHGGDAPLPKNDEISAFVGELIESAPRGAFMNDAEPTAISALGQLVEFLDDEDEENTVQGAIWEWLVFGALDARQQPLVNLIIAKLPRPLTVPERSVLHALHTCRYGLFTIDSFPKPDVAAVRDLLGDETLEIHHPDFAERHEVGQSLGCFVTRTQAGLEVVSGAWQLPDGAEDRFPIRIKEMRDESDLKDATLSSFVTRLSIVVPLLMYEHYGEQQSDQPNLPPSGL